MNLIYMGLGRYIEDDKIKPTDCLMKGDGLFYPVKNIQVKKRHVYDMYICEHMLPIRIADGLKVYAKKGVNGASAWTDVTEIMKDAKDYYVSYPVEHSDSVNEERVVYQENANATPQEYLMEVKKYSDDYKDKCSNEHSDVILNIDTDFPSMFSGYSDNRIWLKVDKVEDLNKEEDFIFFENSEYTINGVEVREVR